MIIQGQLNVGPFVSVAHFPDWFRTQQGHACSRLVTLARAANMKSGGKTAGAQGPREAWDSIVAGSGSRDDLSATGVSKWYSLFGLRRRVRTQSPGGRWATALKHHGRSSHNG